MLIVSSVKSALTAVCRSAVLLGCTAVLLNGCARLHIAGAESDRLHYTAVSELDGVPLFAAAPGSQRVAVSSGGLRVVPLRSGETRLYSADRPVSLSWSPDGLRLAAAFERAAESRITVFGDDGGVTAETAAAGRVAAIFWETPDVLLVVTMELEHHRFGTTCREVLLRWHPGGAMERTVLNDVTLKPVTMRKRGAEQLIRAVSPGVSPLGDELVYGRLHDPPALEPYLDIVIRTISGGAEREIAKTGLDAGTARFSADGEELLVQDAGRIRRLDVWNGAEKQAVAASGRLSALSPDGRRMLVDGRLLDNGRDVAQFASGMTGTFTDDGRLLAADNGTLFLVSGLAASPDSRVLPPEKTERLRALRAWRAGGLISSEEYVTAKEKVLK